MTVIHSPKLLRVMALAWAFFFLHESTGHLSLAVAEAEPVTGNRPTFEPVLLRLTPATEPSPAMKYRLLPSRLGRQPGNAAPFYRRALVDLRYTAPRIAERNANYKDWLSTPLDQFPTAEVKEFLAHVQLDLFKDVRVATHRRYCDWGFEEESLSGTDMLTFLLPEANESREIARLLALKARLAIAERRYSDAIVTLQDGYQLSRDVSQSLFLVQKLVASAITKIMNDQLVTLISAPDSPNLYWALSSLPRPLIDVRESLDFEIDHGYRMFPFLLDAETAERTSDQWHELLVDAFLKLSELADLGDSEVPGTGIAGDSPRSIVQMRLSKMLLEIHPEAKKQLVQSGLSRESVENMSVGQVAAIKASRAHQYLSDEFRKWINFPYSESRLHLVGLEKKLRSEGYFQSRSLVGLAKRLQSEDSFQSGSTKEVLPVGSLLMPSLSAAIRATVRMDRDIAVLRLIEAIRAFAAANQGRLPSSLKEINSVALPLNPVTAEPFNYQSDGTTAVIESFGPPDEPAEMWNNIQYAISISKDE